MKGIAFALVSSAVSQDFLVPSSEVPSNVVDQHTSRRMLDSDLNYCLDLEGKECQWADFSKPGVQIRNSGHSFSSSYATDKDAYDVSKAFDGNKDTQWISSRGSGRSRFLQIIFPEPMQFSMVVLHSDSWPAPFDILVDGIQCARVHFSGRAPCSLSGKVAEIRLASDEASATMSINEVQFAHMPVIRRIICPFLATLVNEKVLNGCVHTREKLLEVTLAAGLPENMAESHINENFANNDAGEQDVCDMEGATNEHGSSTGINDCPTDFGSTPPSTRDKDCGIPNAILFDNFFKHNDENSDNYLTVSELDAHAENFNSNDNNPIGGGTIVGSFTLLFEIFGFVGRHGVKTIYRPELKRLLIERRFPHGYIFGQPSQFRLQGPKVEDAWRWDNNLHNATQLEAQSACLGLVNQEGWTFAVPRNCGGGQSCSTICDGLTESQAGRLQCATALHIYSNQPATSLNNHGLKTHHYVSNGCSTRGCGPNFCCCRAR